MKETELGRFIHWSAAVSVDVAKKLMTVLPISRPEDLIEIPNEESPDDETLSLRVSSW